MLLNVFIPLCGNSTLVHSPTTECCFYFLLVMIIVAMDMHIQV